MCGRWYLSLHVVLPPRVFSGVKQPLEGVVRLVAPPRGPQNATKQSFSDTLPDPHNTMAVHDEEPSSEHPLLLLTHNW